MANCPRCSTPAVPNKFENVPFDDVAGTALAAKRQGHLAHAFSVLAVWACVEGANYVRETWCCPRCDHRFE